MWYISILRHLTLALALCVLTSVIPNLDAVYADSTPKSVNLQTRILSVVEGSSTQVPLEGTYNILVGLFPSGSANALWSKEYLSVVVLDGFLSLILGDPNTPILSDLWNTANVRIGISIRGDDGGYSDPIYVAAPTVPYALQSNISEKTMQILGSDLMHIDYGNGKVGMGITNNITHDLTVSGNVRGTFLVGDGSNLTNLSIFTWVRNAFDDIYYDDGPVGIGTNTPLSLLHVDGDVKLGPTANFNRLLATRPYVGAGTGITDLHADNVVSGVFATAQVQGSYSGIIGLGTVATGSWQATAIQDVGVADDLSIFSGSITGTNNISGVLITSGNVSIGDEAFPLNVSANLWTILGDTINQYSAIYASNNTIINHQFRGANSATLNIFNASDEGFQIGSTGQVIIGSPTGSVQLSLENGFRVSSSDSTALGTIQFTSAGDVRGLTTLGWASLTYFGTWTGNFLDSDGAGPLEMIRVDEDGYVSMGRPKLANLDPDEQLDATGNILFQTNNPLNGLTTAGSGIRMMWVPYKGAFRAGEVQSTQWNYGNIGEYSMAFGRDNTVSARASSVGGGESNSISGSGNVVVGGDTHTITGFYNAIGGGEANTITNQDYSSILGGYTNSIALDGGQAFNARNTILGGQNNSILGGATSVILGGQENSSLGQSNIVGGDNANTTFDNSFVWADHSGAGAFDGTADDQFIIRAANGLGIGSAPTNTVSVVGTASATFIVGNGYYITGVENADYIDGADSSLEPSSGRVVYISRIDGYYPSSSVDTISILNGTLLGEDFSTASITTDLINTGSLLGHEFATGSVYSIHIVDGEVQERHLADGSLGGDNFATGSILTHHIATGSISNDDFAVGSISGVHIVTGSITTAHLAPGVIDDVALAPGGLDGSDFVSGSIGGSRFASGSISIDRFPTNDPVPPGFFGVGSIGSSHIPSASITSNNFSVGAITSSDIAAGTIGWEKFTPPIMVNKGGTGITSYINLSPISAQVATGSVRLMDNGTYFHWDPTANMLALGHDSPTYTIDVSGSVAIQGKTILRTNALDADDNDFLFYSTGTWNGNPGVLDFHIGEPLTSTASTAGLRVTDASLAFRLSVGAGDTLLNTLDVGEDSMFVGSGSTDITENSLVVMGQMGIGESNPGAPYALEVAGAIQVQTDFDGLLIENGISATGVTGMYGYGTDAGVRGSYYGAGPSTYGVLGGSEGDGIGVIGQNPTPSAGGTGIIGGISGSFAATGNIGWVNDGDTQSSAIYGGESSGGTNQFSGIFDGNLYAGALPISSTMSTSARLQLGQSTSNVNLLTVENSDDASVLFVSATPSVGIATQNPQETLHVDGTFRSQHTIGFSQVTVNASAITTIDWRLSNKIVLVVDDNDIAINFTPPPQDSNLTLLIKHTGVGDVNGWDTNVNFVENAGVAVTTGNGAVDIMSLYYDSDADEYYGGMVYDFQ